MTPPPTPTPEPRMRPTSLSTLFVAALAMAAVAWLVISHFYGDMPTLPWLPPFVMFGLAIVEAVLAPSTKARIERRDGAAPVNPLTAAWYVVLAKASALGGALFTGLYAGLLAWLVPQRGFNIHVGHDLPQAIVGVIGALALTLAGLWLERSCRVPPPPSDEDRMGEDRPRGDRSGGRPGGL